MKCIILAAGYATRLYPLTENFPKPLLDVNGKPILDWLIDDIDSEIESFVVISNHKFYDIFREWAEKKSPKITVLDDGTSSNETRLGAVKDIEFALNTLEINDDCLVMAGDNLLDFSLKGFVSFAREKDSSCVMCHDEDRLQALQKTAVITVDEDCRITSYEEKPKEPKGNLAVPPFYFYKSQDIKRIGEALLEGCGYDAPGSFAAWLSGKKDMYAYVMPGKRYDIGDVASYEKVKETWKNMA
ncbi:nucleotidyltransferase family protein [Butyrivibrio sp. MC2021]|uniref:nucleotidyltransferase family protein n=1 Tax=Butyrivibrio sp. MC2021 TaxID=1408306 RepID=UPI00047B7F1E|nr:nucleotidyltransferase family protein [Butyrivibrio sp. MC2021]